MANLAFKVLYCVVAMACILCLIVSIHEFFSVISNRKTAHASPQDGKALTIQAVIDLTSRYDIIDIEACRGNETIRLGSSAESEYRDAPLKNKLFYISDTEYETGLRFGLGNGSSSYMASNSLARNSLLSASSTRNISFAPSYGSSQIAAGIRAEADLVFFTSNRSS